MTAKLYAWGKGEYGQTGLGNTNSYDVPQLVNSDTDWSKIFANKSMGWAIKTNNKLYYTGINVLYNMGFTGSLFSESTNDFQFDQVGTDDWSMIVGLKDRSFNPGTLSRWAVGLKTNGTLWFVGNNVYGTRGNGGTSGNTYDWVQIGTDTDWAYIAGGLKHVVAIKTNGDLYTWGTQEDGGTWLGYLGNNSDTNLYTPTLIDTGYSKCWATRFSSWALKTNGDLYTCGKNDAYIIRSGGTEGAVFKTFGLADSTKFTDISVGGGQTQFALGIDTSGRVWKMGDSGLPSTFAWTKVTGVATSGGWTRLTSTTNNSKVLVIEDAVTGQAATGAVLKSTGALITFGGNDNYQLARGLNTTPYPSVNTAFDSLTTAVNNISSIAGGDGFFLALITSPSASFTTTKSGENTVIFTNTSTNASSYVIDWGDGTSTTVPNNSTTGAPGVGTLSKTYTTSADTQYTITLTATASLVSGSDLTSTATQTFNVFVTQSPTFTVVEQGTQPYVIVRNTSPNTLGATSVFGSGNKWRWEWNGTGTFTDVNSGSGSPGDRLVDLTYTFSFTSAEILAGDPVTRTVTLKAYNGHGSSPFASTTATVTVIPANPNFPNFDYSVDDSIPDIFNAPGGIIWGKP